MHRLCCRGRMARAAPLNRARYSLALARAFAPGANRLEAGEDDRQQMQGADR